MKKMLFSESHKNRFIEETEEDSLFKVADPTEMFMESVAAYNELVLFSETMLGVSDRFIEENSEAYGDNVYSEAVVGEDGVLTKIFNFIADAIIKILSYIQMFIFRLTGNIGGQLDNIVKRVQKLVDNKTVEGIANGTLKASMLSKQIQTLFHWSMFSFDKNSNGTPLDLRAGVLVGLCMWDPVLINNLRLNEKDTDAVDVFITKKVPEIIATIKGDIKVERDGVNFETSKLAGIMQYIYNMRETNPEFLNKDVKVANEAKASIINDMFVNLKYTMTLGTSESDNARHSELPKTKIVQIMQDSYDLAKKNMQTLIESDDQSQANAAKDKWSTIEGDIKTLVTYCKEIISDAQIRTFDSISRNGSGIIPRLIANGIIQDFNSDPFFSSNKADLKMDMLNTGLREHILPTVMMFLDPRLPAAVREEMNMFNRNKSYKEIINTYKGIKKDLMSSLKEGLKTDGKSEDMKNYMVKMMSDMKDVSTITSTFISALNTWVSITNIVTLRSFKWVDEYVGGLEGLTTVGPAVKSEKAKA